LVLVLFAIGVWQFVSAPGDTERQDNINLMNNAISTWTTLFQQPFSAQLFKVQETSTSNLVLDNTADFTSIVGLENYIAVKYDTSSQVFQSSISWNEGLKKTLTFTASGNSTGIFSINVELFSTYQTSDDQSTCNSNDGEWIKNGNCFYYYVLTGICVKVSSNKGILNMDTTYGGPGCWYRNGFPPDVGKWIPAFYSKVSYNNGGIFTQSFPFVRIPITVRNQNDPFIFAEELTLGSLSFGLTPGQKVALGLALMVIGGIFMLPCCIFVVVLSICCQRKHHHHHHYEHI